MGIILTADPIHYQHIIDFLEQYRSFSVLLAILLPVLEAFLPFLPAFAFIFANAAIFGFWQGFLFSWIGSCLGSAVVFLIIRKYGRTRFFRILTRHPKVKVLTSWMDNRGFAPVFLIYCFPFTPSSLITAVSGLSKLNFLDYLLALFLGKAVMIGSLSFISYDLQTFFRSPLRIVALVAVIGFLWLIGKLIEKKLGLRGNTKIDVEGHDEQWKEKRKGGSNG